MRILIKLNFTVLVIAITLYAFLLIYSTALVNVPTEKLMAESFANSINWDVGLGKEVSPTDFIRNESLWVINLRSILAGDRLRILSYTPLVKDSVTFQALRPVPGNGSMIGQPSCVALSKALAQISLVVEAGIPIPLGYSFWSPYRELTPEDAYLLKQVTGLSFRSSPYEVSQFMKDMDEHFRSYSVGGSAVSMRIPYTKYYLVIDIVNGGDALVKALKALRKAGSICGFNITYVSSWKQSLLKFSARAFLKPLTLKYTIDQLRYLTLKIRDDLGYEVATVNPQWSKLEEIQKVRSGLLEQTFLASLPAIAGLLLTLPLISPPSLLLDKLLIEIMKLRGMSYSRLKYLLFMKTVRTFLIFSSVVATFLIMVAFILGSETINEALNPILFAVALSTGLFLSVIHWWLSTSSRIKSYLISPAGFKKPWIKVRFGLIGWLSLSLGLYFAAYGIINPSILTLQGRPSLSILMSLFSLVNEYLAPFAPIFLGYGLGMLLSINYGEIAQAFAKISKGLGKCISKSLSIILASKVYPLMVVSVIFIALLTSSSVLTVYNASLIRSATEGSLGSYVLGYKEVLIPNLSELLPLISNLSDEFNNKDLTLVGEVEGYISWSINASTYLEPTDIVFINTSSFIKDTYFMSNWLLSNESLGKVIKNLRNGNALIALTPYSTSIPHIGDYCIISSVLDAPGVKVRAINYLTGFPGLPYLMSSPYLVVLDLKVAGNEEWDSAFSYAIKESIVRELDVRLYAFSKNISVVNKLSENGFKTISLNKVDKDSSYKLLNSIINIHFPEYLASIITLFLIAFLTLIIEHLALKELKPLIKLYKLRLVKLKELMKSLILTYVLPVIMSVVFGALAGYILGASIAIGSVNNFPPIITLPHSLARLPIKISLWLGNPTLNISVESLSLVITYVVLISSVPLYLLFKSWKSL